MKRILGLIIAMSTVACATVQAPKTPFEENLYRQELIKQHLMQGKEYLGGDFDFRFSKAGNDGVNVQAVGIAVYPANANEGLIRKAAIVDGKMKLVTSGPTEFKSMVQRATGNALGYTGDFHQIETSVSEVSRLEGIKQRDADVECKNVVEPTQDGTFRNNKECRAIVSVPFTELRKAFDYTLEKKYGLNIKSQVEKILNIQLEKSSEPRNP